MTTAAPTRSVTPGTVRPGTIRSALRSHDYRTVVIGMSASNVGTWMQAVVVGALAYDLTRDPFFVGLVTFAAYLPAMLLSLVGGAIADHFDRKRLIIWLSVVELVGSLLLAWVAAADEPSHTLLLGAVLLVGIGSALQGPAFSSLTPVLVPREDIRGVVSLNQVSWNGSRVIGPALGGLLYSQVGAAWVFAGNALTYLFMVVAMTRIHVPPTVRRHDATPTKLLLGGLTYVRDEPVVRRVITVVVLFTMFCLTFVTQMPVVATENFGIRAKSTTYGVLYAMLALGAMTGALAIGTFLAGRRIDRVVRGSFAGFALSLAGLAVLRSPAAAFPAMFVVGFFYYASLVAVSTVFQSRLDDHIRGRATAVWLMAALGTAPLANLLGGWLTNLTSITTVMLASAAIALAIAWYADVGTSPDPSATEEA